MVTYFTMKATTTCMTIKIRHRTIFVGSTYTHIVMSDYIYKLCCMLLIAKFPMLGKRGAYTN